MLRLEALGLLVRRAPAAAAQIVTDSTADLPADLARAHGIAVVPLTVAFGKEVFRDRVDLRAGPVLRPAARSEGPSGVEPAAAQDFAARYQEWLSRAARSSRSTSRPSCRRPSRTPARGAAATLPGSLTVLDSGQVSLGLGLLALIAGRLAARHETGERIVQSAA